MTEPLFVDTFINASSRLADSRVMRELKKVDWSTRPVGSPDTWPQTLKSVARIVFAADALMTVLVGRAGALVFNDAVRTRFYPDCDEAFGRPVTEVLPEHADFFRNVIDACYRGETPSFHDLPFTRDIGGNAHTAWFDVNFTPILDDAGLIHGTLLCSYETTDRVNANRALRKSEERLSIALNASGVIGVWELDLERLVVTSDERFANLYGVNPEDTTRGAPGERFIAGVHPDDRENLRAAMRNSIRNDTDFHCQYRLVGSGSELRTVIGSGRPMHDDTGKTSHFLGCVVDITEQVETTMALAESEYRFRMLAETLPQTVWSTDADGTHDYFSKRWYEFTGEPCGPVPPDRWRDLVHPDDRDRVFAYWERCRRNGEHYDIDYRFWHVSGEHRWMRVMAKPLFNKEGRLTRWFGTATDIHDQMILAAERDIVTRELDHRIKNVFAVVSSLIALSERDHPSFHGMAGPLKARLDALLLAHSFVRTSEAFTNDHSNARSLQILARTLVAPYADDAGQRFIITGDDFAVSDTAVTTLALVIHELATNAAKYGALSAQMGNVHLQVTRSDPRFTLTWTEHVPGARIKPSAESGFGGKLLAILVEKQLRGAMERRWGEEGLQVEINAPLAKVLP